MFKFMTVLRPEVWYGILGAVVGKHLCKENLIKILLWFFFFTVVSILIWGLDRFSPYSYYNNKEAYPEGARDFTIGESIWFSLTSLTPQGGGECPKALSGRVLVAAYWLFIVLMLATFTANLAAFLTVERWVSNNIRNCFDMPSFQVSCSVIKWAATFTNACIHASRGFHAIISCNKIIPNPNTTIFFILRVV